MKIVHVVPSLEERHGGPSKSVRALANAQADLGHEVTLLATQEPGQPAPLASNDTATLKILPRRFPLAFCRSPELRAALTRDPGDCVHNHALWLLTLRYAHQASRRKGRTPLIVSPRGMLSGWAYTHNRWKKTLARRLIHPGAMAAASGWHATSAEEAEDIRKLGYRQPVCVAPNGVEIPSIAELDTNRHSWERICPALAGRRVALFYSRFHRKKRLRELIDLWLLQARSDWILLLVGVPEEYSVAEIESWIKTQGAEEKIRVFDGSNLPPPFAIASLFLLPSHSENFGLVVTEAMAAGVPVLVTDTTPWSGVSAREAGWCVAWESYPSQLENALLLPPAPLRAMGQNAREWAGEEFTWKRSASLLLEFYRQLSPL